MALSPEDIRAATQAAYEAQERLERESQPVSVIQTLDVGVQTYGLAALIVQGAVAVGSGSAAAVSAVLES